VTRPAGDVASADAIAEARRELADAEVEEDEAVTDLACAELRVEAARRALREAGVDEDDS